MSAKSQLTQDISACSEVPQTTAPPRTGFLWTVNYFIICYLDEFQDSGIRVDDVFVLDFSYSVTQSFQIKYSVYK